MALVNLPDPQELRQEANDLRAEATRKDRQADVVERLLKLAQAAANGEELPSTLQLSDLPKPITQKTRVSPVKQQTHTERDQRILEVLQEAITDPLHHEACLSMKEVQAICKQKLDIDSVWILRAVLEKHFDIVGKGTNSRYVPKTEKPI